MPEEFGGDLTAAVFWGADLRGARFRDVNLTDVTISHARLVDVEIDAFIDRVVVNGVDVTAFVNEHDPWYPLRSVLRVSIPRACAPVGPRCASMGGDRRPGPTAPRGGPARVGRR